MFPKSTYGRNHTGVGPKGVSSVEYPDEQTIFLSSLEFD